MFPSVKRSGNGEGLHLQGEAFEAARRLPAYKVLHGHDEHGKKITLLRASARSSRSTLAMSRLEFSSQAVIFGENFDPQAASFAGLRMRVDHLDEWLGRCAFQHFNETFSEEDGRRRLSKVTIPVARNGAISLGLPGYRGSRFFCSYTMSYDIQRFEMSGCVYLDLMFETPLPFWELMEHVHRWEWFFSLAAGDTLDLAYLEIYPSGGEDDGFPNGGYPVWVRRRNNPTPRDSKFRSEGFHFTYPDTEADFPDIVRRWQNLRNSWDAVLHRWYAVMIPRDLWINERFLFLAQGLESMHRAKQGVAGQVDLATAAKCAWEAAPPELREILGKKRNFKKRYRKTRNYWTHYGEPSPATDPEVLDDDELFCFTEALRYVIEAALLTELGVPESCVRKVWSQRWRSHLVDFT